MDWLKPVFPEPLHVAVLQGGDSAERDISLHSGAAVTRAIAGQGHQVTQIDPAETRPESVDWQGIDIAFLALHGTYGEDGSVQEILEQCGVPFTGSSPDASRLAFGKSAAKERFSACGVPTAPSALFSHNDPHEQIESRAARIGFPVVVKPDAQGSSLGVTIVHDENGLPNAVKHCLALSGYGLIEQAVDGSEWTLGVVDDDPLPLIQIGTSRNFFDYQAKYEDDETACLFDTASDESTRRRIEAAGLAACRALGTRGIARVDIMLDAAGQPWVLEVNTIPGMTDHSLVPKAAARAGLALGELCDIVISRTLTGSPAQKLRDAS